MNSFTSFAPWRLCSEIRSTKLRPLDATISSARRLPLLWFVENIEAIYREYTDRGVSIADALRTHTYGLKEFAFVELNGYYVRVAEEVGYWG